MFSTLMVLISSLILSLKISGPSISSRPHSWKGTAPSLNLRHDDLKVHCCLSEICHQPVNQNTSVRPGERKQIGRTPMPFSIIYESHHGDLLLSLLERGVNHNFMAYTHTITHDKRCCSILWRWNSLYKPSWDQMFLGHLTPICRPFVFFGDSLYFLYHCTSQTPRSGRTEVELP